MNVVIRTDASTSIGTGHVMRCLTLADGLRENGARTSFVCREEPGNLITLIEKRGYPVHRLPAGIGPSEDRERTGSLLDARDRSVDWLIVDHYGLDRSYESGQRPHAARIMAIDDLADREHDCDLLLDQNYGAPGERYDRLVPPSCKKTLGTSFALVRPEYLRARDAAGVRNGRIRSVLVFLGGSDRTNETSKVLRAISRFGGGALSTDVVIGPSNENRSEIEDLASRIPSCRCHVGIPSLAELMATADLAIGAGGSTMWERCCAGLPTLAITVADNQFALTEALARDGYIVYAGTSSSVTEQTLLRDLAFLAAHPGIVRLLSERCRSLVDGRGVDRVVRMITASVRPVVLRPAEERDCRTVFDWRNHPSVLSASFDPRPLHWDMHQRWFTETLLAAQRALLIAEIGTRAVGVLRYDFRGDEAEVSIYLDPTRTGTGIGPDVLNAGTEWVRTNRRSVRKIVARVKPGNETSFSAFRRAQFEEHHCSFQRTL